MRPKWWTKKSPDFFLTLAVFVLVGVFAYFPTTSRWSSRIDFSVFEYQDHPTRSDVVLVALDNATLNNPDFKRYADISRADYAQVLENILADSPRGIGVDVFFFNEDQNPVNDQKLAAVLANNENIVIGNEYDFSAEKFLLPTEKLSTSFKQQGSVNLSTSSFDEKNLVNTVPLIIDKNNVAGVQYEPFIFRVLRTLSPGLQTAQLSKDKSKYKVIAGDQSWTVPLQLDQLNIHFFSHKKPFPMVSFYDVWKGDFDPQVFQEKIVLIGATAHDIHDEFFTPVSTLSFMAGVEIHANALQTVLDEKYIWYQNFGEKIAFLLLVAVLSFLVNQLPKLWMNGLGSVALGSVVWLGAVGSYLHFGKVVGLVWALVLITLVWISIQLWRFLKTDRQKQVMKKMFSEYVSPAVVQQLVENPDLINLQGESRKITVFFSDLRGFTSLVEPLSPSEAIQVLNRYFDVMAQSILQAEGTVDKFMGDAIMAFWGAPLDCENHAERACLVALEQQEILEKLNTEFKAEGHSTLGMRIGINTGVASIGNIGTTGKKEFTAIGDSVNLGSRLESMNNYYGTDIMISEETKAEISADFLVRTLDKIRVKGKKEPVTVYELVGMKTEVPADVQKRIETYEEGLNAYWNKDWELAQKNWRKISSDQPAQAMLERLESLDKKSLPKNWDGVYTYEKK